MRLTTICLLFLSLLMFSCKRNKKTMLTGKWNVVKFENNLQMLIGKWNAVYLSNPENDNFFKNSQVYIDTVGRNNDAATNQRIYGVSDMDSLRSVLQQQFDEAKHMQDSVVAHTWFLFNDDGTAILSFNGGIDTSRWYIDSTGGLLLEDMNQAKVQMEIITLTDTLMKLGFREGSSYSVVSFHPEGGRVMAQEPIVNTFFDFRKDNVVVLSFDGSVDSSRWFMENDSMITLQNFNNKRIGEQLHWSILALTDTNLILKIIENSSVSTVTFHPDKK